MHLKNTQSAVTHTLSAKKMHFFAVPSSLFFCLPCYHYYSLLLWMRDFSVVSAPASFGFAKTRARKKTPAALLDHDEPHRGEAFMWLPISIWLLMGAHRPRKASGLWISWLPTFSSKWLIRGGYAERTGETAVGVWLSSGTLVGDNLSARLPRLHYKTQPCLASLCNGLLL